ncbi:poly-beta-hydroxybutyrate-responsive repressor [Desulfofundulus luciae]|uniref:Poly-beta-hydroxybutyrate-responsive repressor n=1 Tax=Desulfofundulus luciae TaxID=74702 RepID=A0ABU0AYC5_9FIRM|nr:helix-turn-helix transcriptional regulator [Desulfofundulus luciae]MDQ0285258.1 poly-beta-hydroxybutyrate-responsive repressor [Desulfofundulus luciae]
MFQYFFFANYMTKSIIGVSLILEIKNCPCEGKYLDKMVQPAILIILTEANLHGYKIVQRLAETPMFNGDEPDPTGVYRCLKAMEKRGLIVSCWDISRTGPAKRFYRITEGGKECLRRWIETLEEYQRIIGMLLSEAKKVTTKDRS